MPCECIGDNSGCAISVLWHCGTFFLFLFLFQFFLFLFSLYYFERSFVCPEVRFPVLHWGLMRMASSCFLREFIDFPSLFLNFPLGHVGDAAGAIELHPLTGSASLRARIDRPARGLCSGTLQELQVLGQWLCGSEITTSRAIKGSRMRGCMMYDPGDPAGDPFWAKNPAAERSW